jgi:hypothetical protein
MREWLYRIVVKTTQAKAHGNLFTVFRKQNKNRVAHCDNGESTVLISFWRERTYSQALSSQTSLPHAYYEGKCEAWLKCSHLMDLWTNCYARRKLCLSDCKEFRADVNGYLNLSTPLWPNSFIIALNNFLKICHPLYIHSLNILSCQGCCVKIHDDEQSGEFPNSMELKPYISCWCVLTRCSQKPLQDGTQHTHMTKEEVEFRRRKS